MDWGYIAGFFDGEGWISLWQREKRTDYSIGCCQSTPQDAPLYIMRDFLNERGIYAKVYVSQGPQGLRRQGISKLYVQGNRNSRILFLEYAIPHLVIKKERAEHLLAYLKSLPIGNTKHYPEEQERRCKEGVARYQQGDKLKTILRELVLAETTFRRFMKKNGIPMRTPRECRLMTWNTRRKKEACR